MAAKTNRYRFELVVAPEAEREALFFKKMANDIIFESPQLQQMEHKARLVLFGLWDSCWRNYVETGPRVIRILPPRVGRADRRRDDRGRQGPADLRLARRPDRRHDRAHLPAAVRPGVRIDLDARLTGLRYPAATYRSAVARNVRI